MASFGSFQRLFATLCLTAVTAGCSDGVREAKEWNALFRRDRSYGWAGGDGAHSVPLPGQRTLWLFGDTLLGEVTGAARKDAGARFGSTVALQKTPAPGDDPLAEEYALEFDWSSPGSSGWMPIFDETLEDPTLPPTLRAAVDDGAFAMAWPLHGYVVNDDLVLFNTLITPKPCDDCGLATFEVHGSMASVVSGVDRPYDQWGFETEVGWTGARPFQRPLPAVSDLPPGGHTFWGVYVMPDPGAADALLVFGHRYLGTTGELIVARVEGVQQAEHVLEFSRWRFWDGTDWSHDPKASAGVLTHAATEISVIPVPESYGAGYAVVHSGFDQSGKVRVAFSDSITGPYEEGYVFTLTDCPIEGFDTGDPPLVYAAKAHEHLSTEDDLLVSLVLSPHGVPERAGDMRFYTPRFLYLPWTEVLENEASAPERCDMPVE